MASVLKPEGSLTLGVATAAMVYGIYSTATPPTSVIHATQANDDNVERGRKKAAWTSVVAVAAISLMARDKTIFILGGATVFALDWHTRHANAVAPDTGQLVDNNGYQPATNNVVAMTQPVEAPIAGQAAY
jgi:hypothetical protein